MRMRPTLAVLALPLLLAACGDDAVAPDNDERTASGEVLEGSISDAMLPQEMLTSQPPLIEDAPSASGDAEVGEVGKVGGEGEASEGEAGEGEETAEAQKATAAAAPAAEDAAGPE